MRVCGSGSSPQPVKNRRATPTGKCAPVGSFKKDPGWFQLVSYDDSVVFCRSGFVLCALREGLRLELATNVCWDIFLA